MKEQFRLVVFACTLVVLATQAAFSQSTTSDTPPPPAPAPRAAASSESNGYVGVGAKVSTLGVGVEVAARVLPRANVRAGFNVLGYSRTFNKDGIAYGGHLNFKTVEGHFDIFPWAGSFHVGPGILAYIGDPIKANANVAASQSFSLGGTTYYSDPSAPTYGNGKIDFNSVAPTLTFGWGNLVPRRNSKHFSIPVELGVAFQGSPKATLNLSGNVCDAVNPSVNCRSVTSDPAVLSNVVSEQTKLNNSMSVFKAYPIISVGFGYKF